MITSVSQVYMLRSRVTTVIVISIPSAHRNRHSEFLLAIFFPFFEPRTGFLWGAAPIQRIILKYKISCNIQRKVKFRVRLLSSLFVYFYYILRPYFNSSNLFYCTSESFIIYFGIKPTKSQNRKGAINCDVDTGAKLRIPATLQIPWGK